MSARFAQPRLWTSKCGRGWVVITNKEKFLGKLDSSSLPCVVKLLTKWESLDEARRAVESVLRGMDEDAASDGGR